MGLDYSRLRSLTAREIITALLRDGYSLDRQSGAHRLYRHPDGRRVTVTRRRWTHDLRPDGRFEVKR